LTGGIDLPYINKSPDPCEGPHCQLGVLIREEAKRHFEICNFLAKSEPELGTVGLKLKDLERGIREAIAWDWARVLPDWSGIVHLNPFVLDPTTLKGTYEPWSAELLKLRMGLELDIRATTEAFTNKKDPGIVH
jgi:hypothetical protein